MVFFHKVLYPGIYVKYFFNAGRSFGKLPSGRSPGGPGRSKNPSWRGPGASRRRPRGSKKRVGKGKSGQERPRAILEPSWVQKTKDKGGRTTPFGRPGAAFREAVSGLGVAFLSDLVAHRFFIDFASIFRRFWDGFWYQKWKKKETENGANFEVFFWHFLR